MDTPPGQVELLIRVRVRLAPGERPLRGLARWLKMVGRWYGVKCVTYRVVEYTGRKGK